MLQPQIPVQTNQNNTISVQFLTFSLKLTVTPQITDVGTILLSVQIENSEPDFARAVNGIPSVRTQQAQTQVLDEPAKLARRDTCVDPDPLRVSSVLPCRQCSDSEGRTRRGGYGSISSGCSAITRSRSCG